MRKERYYDKDSVFPPCKQCLKMALAGKFGDEAATPLSFPHINQDEANQAKFNRKEPCQDGLTFPALCLARLQAVH